MSGEWQFCDYDFGGQDEFVEEKKTTMVERARLLGSEGKGLGQQTGGYAASDRDEALKILFMIQGADLGELPSTQREFVEEQLEIRYQDNFHITGRQLFYLRDIKDKLVDTGKV